MKLLIVTFTFPPEANGVSHVAYAHAKGFVELGHAVTVATTPNNERKVDKFLAEGIKIFQFSVKGSGNIRVGYSGEIEKYQDFIATYDADIILFHCWGWASDLAIPVFPLNKAKKILVSHGVSANSIYSLGNIVSWLCWRPYIWNMPKMMKRFDHIVFLSDRQDKDRFYDLYLAKKIGFKNFSIIPNGTYDTSSNTQSDFKNKFGIKSKKMILSVGDYTPMKNQEMSLKAFFKSRVSDATLVYIGNKKNAYSARLETLAKQMGIGDKVLFFDGLSQKDIVDAYLSSDLFILSSLSEVQPLVILDAMRAGVTFISTDVGCVSNLPGGLTVKSILEMSEKIKILIEDEDLRRELGMKGKKACEKLYSWDIVIDKYESLLKLLTSKES